MVLHKIVKNPKIQKILDEVNQKLGGKVVTVIRKEKNYCKAEEYHQKYFEKRNKR